MFRYKKTIKELKKLKNKPVDSEFLKVLRSELGEYMSYNPVRESATYNVPVRSPFMSNIMRLGVMIPLILGLVLLGGGGVAYASQEALPGETLYPIKTLTEDMRSVLTSDPVSKARLEVSFAERRVKELKELLEEKKEVESKGLAIAEARLKKNLARATDMVEVSVKEGNNGEFAAEIVNKLNRQRKEAHEVFVKSQKGFRAKQKELHGKLLKALSDEDLERKESLQDELDEIETTKIGIKKHQDSFIGLMEKEKSRILDDLEEEVRQIEKVRIISEKAEETKQEAEEVWEEIEDELGTAEKALDIVEDARDIGGAVEALDLVKDVLDMPEQYSETGDSTEVIDVEIENVLEELNAIGLDLNNVDVPR